MSGMWGVRVCVGSVPVCGGMEGSLGPKVVDVCVLCLCEGVGVCRVCGV